MTGFNWKWRNLKTFFSVNPGSHCLMHVQDNSLICPSFKRDLVTALRRGPRSWQWILECCSHERKKETITDDFVTHFQRTKSENEVGTNFLKKIFYSLESVEKVGEIYQCAWGQPPMQQYSANQGLRVLEHTQTSFDTKEPLGREMDPWLLLTKEVKSLGKTANKRLDPSCKEKKSQCWQLQQDLLQVWSSTFYFEFSKGEEWKLCTQVWIVKVFKRVAWRNISHWEVRRPNFLS